MQIYVWAREKSSQDRCLQIILLASVPETETEVTRHGKLSRVKESLIKLYII